jgi:hypothetical protein
MLICAAGDIHGAMNRLYQDVFAFEASLGVRFDYVLHVGGFGIWPDPSRIDKATRHHDGVGDFPAWLRENRGAPRPTLLIKGSHEDFVWLDAHQDAEVLPGLTYLRNGCTVAIQDRGVGAIRVGGVDGCYGPSDYRRRSDRLQGYAKNDTTRQMRLNGLRSQAAWTSCLLTMRQQAYVSSGIVGVQVTSAKRRDWMCFWHSFSRASASLVIITPESTPTFQVFAALGSTKSECREIW